jgi:hypothetical protein
MPEPKQTQRTDVTTWKEDHENTNHAINADKTQRSDQTLA